jgi:membrane protein
VTERLPGLIRGIVERFRENELLLRASAIAFQVLTAVVPFTLFAVGAAGFAGFDEVYDRDLAPQLREAVSIAAYTLIDDTAREVLGGRNTFWATGGLLLAIWQLSGAVRTVGSSLDDFYDHEDERPWKERMLQSLLIAAGVVFCIGGALLVTGGSQMLYGDVPLLADVLLFIARYGVAVVLVMLAIGLVVRHAPSERRPVHWVTGGAVLVTVCWIAVTAAFGLYITAIASYGSIYGVFVTIVVLLAWCYASALAFVAGIATDAELRGED